MLFLNLGLVGVPALERTILAFLQLFGYTRYAWAEVGTSAFPSLWGCILTGKSPYSIAQMFGILMMKQRWT